MSVPIPPELLGLTPPPGVRPATPALPPGPMPPPPPGMPPRPIPGGPPGGGPPNPMAALTPGPGSNPAAMALGQVGQMAGMLQPQQMMQGMLGQVNLNPETSFTSSGGGHPAGPPPGPLDPTSLPDPSDPMSDPALRLLLHGAPLLRDPEAGLPDPKKRGYRPLPDEGYIRDVAQRDHDLHVELLDRFNRDLLLYRNYRWLGATPPLFDPRRDIAFRSATLPNIVDKLSNMLSGVDHRYVVDYKDQKTQQASQVIENFHLYNRHMLETEYAGAGGEASLQWSEFFSLFLYGRLVYRVLPDPDAADRGDPHPYHETLLDPGTVFPTWGGEKGSLVRITRIYPATMMDVLEDYGDKVPGLEQKMIQMLGYTTYREAAADNQNASDVTEYWDTWNYAIYYRGVEVIRASHKLGYVPFVYVLAKGEPRNFVLPTGTVPVSLDGNNNPSLQAGLATDLREKGISVFHHIIQTDRMGEVVYSLLLTEVLKAQNPPVIRYQAQSLEGKTPPPLRAHAGATNLAKLNAEKIDSFPTSPRPTDTSPVLGKIQKDITEGSINTAMFGGMDGSNVAGFAVESLISAARDTVLPYEQAWMWAQALRSELVLKQYRSHIWMRNQAAVPMDGRYGTDASIDLKPEMVDLVGTRCRVELVGVPDQALPMVMNASIQAIHEGIWSRRKGMEKIGEKDPDRMLSDIIAERAMEHPEMMENFIIPMGFIKRGQEDFAKLWILFIIMPKLQKMMASMMPMMQPSPTPMGSPGGLMSSIMGGGNGSIPSGPSGPALAPGAGGPPPGVNGMSNPMMGRAMGPPTGPLPGQGGIRPPGP